LIESEQYSQKKLSTLVSHELQIIIKKTQAEMYPNDALNYVNNILGKHRLLNTVRCFFTEFSFICLNFFRLLFVAPNEASSTRLKVLSEGAKQYFAYINPRVSARHRDNQKGL